MDNKMEATILEMMEKVGGIEKFQSNPMAFIGEVFKHPELLSKIDQLAKTPEMQKQIQESMNSPMFQQIVGNNPLLSGMMNDYQNRQAQASSNDSDADELEGDESEGLVVDGYDFKIPGWQRVDWLNPMSMTPFYVPDDESKRIRFSKILDELPEECCDRVKEIAEKRLEMHMDASQMERLEEFAGRYFMEPMDLMASTGFLGEVSYCATLVMPDDDLCDLAKAALASLHNRSGYPVASYLLQNILYLDSFDDIELSDWENFAWSLSGNPVPGRDGNFTADWEEVNLVTEIAAENLADNPELYLGICLGLVSWNAFVANGIQQPLLTLLGNAHNKVAVRDLLLKALRGSKIYAISVLQMNRSIKRDIVDFIIEADGASALRELSSELEEDQRELDELIELELALRHK